MVTLPCWMTVALFSNMADWVLYVNVLSLFFSAAPARPHTTFVLCKACYELGKVGVLQSCQNPQTMIATFKGKLCRAHQLCSSPDQTQKEINFLLDLYEDNGYDRAKLTAIAAEYKPPSSSQPRKKERNKRTHTSRQSSYEETIPENLFDVLPFKDDNSTDEEYKPFACIPGGISYLIKRSLTEAGINTCFTSGTKLKDILCSKNKSKIDPAQKPGIYKHICPKCNKVYSGQTRRCCETRWREHQRAIEKGNWSHSGISQHY